MPPRYNHHVLLLETPWSCDVHSHAAALQQWMHQTQPPKAAAQCRKHHLQTATWKLIQSKRFHWNRIRQLRRTWRQGVLREIFAAWHLKKIQMRCLSFGHGSVWLIMQLRFTPGNINGSVLQWPYAVKQDDKAFYVALAAEQGDIAADEGLSGLWRKIKHLRPKGVARRKANIRCVGPQVEDLTAITRNLKPDRRLNTQICFLNVPIVNVRPKLSCRCKSSSQTSRPGSKWASLQTRQTSQSTRSWWSPGWAFARTYDTSLRCLLPDAL